MTAITVKRTLCVLSSWQRREGASASEMPTRFTFPWFGDGIAVGMKKRGYRESTGTGRVEGQEQVTLLSLPDDLLLMLFRHLLSTPCPTLPLSARALESSASAFALAGSCSRLRALFRLSVPSLSIHWHTPVYPHVLASVFAPALRALRVHGHPRADVLLRELAAFPGQLRLRSLALAYCPAPANPIQAILRAGPPLEELHLAFVHCDDLNALLMTVAPKLDKLRRLTLYGVSQLSEEALLTICKSTRENLSHFALRYVRHPSITDETLLAIKGLCPSITALFLDDLRHVTAEGVCRFVSAYAWQLDHLRLYGCRLTPGQLKMLLQKACQLRALGVEEASWSEAMAASVVDALVVAGDGLTDLHLRSVTGLVDIHMGQLISSMPRLERLTVRRQELLTDMSLFHIARLGGGLKALDMRGCFVTDDGLRAVGGQCTKLEEVALGGDGQELSEEGARRLGNDAVSNQGMASLLAGCGKSLTHFSWESPRCRMRGASQTNGGVTVGVANLSAKFLARTLAAHCPNLLRVEVNGLRPSGREKVERARCDLAFMELEEDVKTVDVFIDREHLSLDGNQGHAVLDEMYQFQ